MNERIRELVGQAKFMAEETLNKQISKNAELDAFAEKFAELLEKEIEAKHFSAGYIAGRSDGIIEIVQKCVEIASEYDAPKMSGPGMIIAGRIKSHFGVEE